MRERLLFVSPVAPAMTGNGLAMRAGMTLRAFAGRYRVSLLVVPRYLSPAGLPPEIAARCEEVVTLAPGDLPAGLARPRWLTRLAPARSRRRSLFRNDRFDIVHAFRLAALPGARPWLDADPAPRRWLDLDEIESAARPTIAAQWRERGRPELAAREDAAAIEAAAREDEALAAFDRVFVASGRDRDDLIGRGHADLRLLPNALPIPAPLPPPPTDGPIRLLFVGTLGYAPNDAAAIALCREIVPALRAMTPRAVTATIAGGGAGPELRQAAKAAAVDLPGYVADLASVYRDAHVAVVSVRAGGGTRIKAIEAFAWRRPVVSTAFGVEGLGVRDGEHLLLADESEAMARQCLRLLAEPDLAGELVERAWRSFVSAWSTERLDAIVAALDAEPLPRATPAASARRDPR